MSNKRKKQTRALAKKLGVPYQHAHNIRTNSRPPTALELLLQQLRARSTFAVLAGRMLPIGTAAVMGIARERMLELVNNPKWYAKVGSVEITIPEEQYNLLIANGAAEAGKVSVLRTFLNDFGTEFSEACSFCHRFILCGTEQREATCVCGTPYRVVFDLPEHLQWSQRQGIVCATCSASMQMTEPSEGRNPWHFVNEWQHQCDRCHRERPAEAFEVGLSRVGFAEISG